GAGPAAARYLPGRLAAPPRPRLARQCARAARRDPSRGRAQRGRGGARSPLAPREARGAGPPRSSGGGLSLRELAELGAAEAEQQAIREALRASRGNKSAAARLLKTDYKTLHAKMRQYAITADEHRPA